MKIPIIIASVLIIALIIWIVWSLIAVRNLEEPKYTVISEKDWYEIRKYASYIVAEVEVTGWQNEALNKGFSLLAGYIFWWNTSKTSIAMTVPVAEVEDLSQNIAMTVPVSNTLDSGDTRKVQFSMPSKYTLETLPKPNNDKVTLKTLPWYSAAVLQYSGYATESKVEKMKAKLVEKLTADKVEIVWDIVSAQYNPPFSFPLMRRNEIIVTIK